MGSDLYGQGHLICKRGYYKTGCKLCKAEEKELKEVQERRFKIYNDILR